MNNKIQIIETWNKRIPKVNRTANKGTRPTLQKQYEI